MNKDKIDKFFLPKVPAVPTMCARCPFNQTGNGYAVDHPEFPDIVSNIQIGLPFMCHETVILHPDTTMKFDPVMGEPVPNPPFQDHFRSCKGAVMFKRGEIEVPAPKVPAIPPQMKKRKRK